jgi:hypothetical protein
VGRKLREAQAELEAFKKKVREEALSIQESQGWCDDGFNEAMRALGLPEKQTFFVPVTVDTVTKPIKSTWTVKIKVTDAQTEEEARASVTERLESDKDEVLRDQLVLSSYETVEARVQEEPLPVATQTIADSTGGIRLGPDGRLQTWNTPAIPAQDTPAPGAPPPEPVRRVRREQTEVGITPCGTRDCNICWRDETEQEREARLNPVRPVLRGYPGDRIGALPPSSGGWVTAGRRGVPNPYRINPDSIHFTSD